MNNVVSYMTHKKVLTLVRLALILLMVVLYSASSVINVYADAMTKDQQLALSRWTNWVGLCGASPSDSSSDVSSEVGPGPVYILGDSITALAKNTYSNKFKQAGWDPTINAYSGRHISQTSEGGSGIEELKADASKYKSANAIVVALGTNDDSNSKASTEGQVKDAVKIIKKNSSAPIFWVNVMDSSNLGNARTTNDGIESGVGSDGKIIDWYSEAKSGADYKNFDEGVHPTKQKDIDLLVNLVYKSVSSFSTSSKSKDSSSGSSGTTKGVTFTTQMTIDNDGVGSSHNDPDHQGQTSYANGKLNADETNYIALAPGWSAAHGLVLGDVAMVTRGGKTAFAVYGDNYSGSEVHGEGSVHLSLALGGDSNNTIPAPVHYTVYPGSHKQLDGSVDQAKIDEIGKQLSGASSATDAPAKTCCPSGNSTPAADTQTDSLPGSNNQQKVFNYMIGKGLSDVQAAAIVGNWQQESGVNPKSGKGGGHIGIAQWDSVSRWPALETFAKKKNKSPYTLSVQLDFAWQELTGSYKSSSLDPLKATNDIAEAVHIILNYYEGAAGQQEAERLAYAKGALKHYGGTQPSGADQPNTSTSDTSSAGACQCPAGSQNSSGDGKIVVLDPGHSENSIIETDPASKIKTSDGNNGQENKDVWYVSEKVKAALDKKGYKVISTKKKEDDTVGLLSRAKIANDANADLAVSIHTTGGGQSAQNWVTPQKVGYYRQTGSNKKTFTDESLAKKSLEYANDINKARKSAQGASQIHDLDFPASRGLGAVGNISIVQLFSKQPWVYNESGQTGLDKDKYAEGLVKGIDDALGGSGSSGSSGGSSDSSGTTSCGGSSTGDASAAITKALEYAWADGRRGSEQKPEYTRAIKKAKAKGLYIGGGAVDGNDCGAFITRVMQDSGADPKYNTLVNNKKGGPTHDQEAYMKAHPDMYESLGTQTSTAKLKPGDIAINDHHTFMYIGKQDGLSGTAVSASLPNRAPTVDNPYWADSSAGVPFQWYRLKS